MLSMPKILFIFPQKQPCGILDYSESLLTALGKYGFEIKTAAPPSDSSRLDALLADAENYNIIHVQYDAAYWTVNGKNIFSTFAKTVSKPIVITLHEVYDQNPFDFPYDSVRSLVPGLAVLKRFLYRKRHPNFTSELELCKQNYFAKTIIVHNEFQKETLIKKGVAGDIIRVIPHGVWDSKKSPFRANPQKWVFGTFGFISPSVDYAVALEALSSLNIDWEYVIGGGPRRAEQAPLVDEITHCAEKLGVRSRVKLTGPVEEEKIPDFFQTLDIYLAPFKFKSSSGSLNRALSAALPCVAPRIPLTEEMNVRVPALALYEQDDLQSMRSVIQKLTGDVKYRIQCVQHSCEYAERYSFTHEAEQLFRLYGKI